MNNMGLDAKTAATPPPYVNFEPDHWTWDKTQKSCDAHFLDHTHRSVIFHPTWSNGTSAVRGTRALNNTRAYWEVSMLSGLGGTSLMLGVGTKQASLGTHTFCDILGKDKHSWGMNHRGLIWHKGKSEKYCPPSMEYDTPVIGVLFDGIQGTLTYFKDGVNYGIAFRGLDKIRQSLYPMISSTSVRSVMILQHVESEFSNLQDRCRAAILRTWKLDHIEKLSIPLPIRNYLKEAEDDKRCKNCAWYVPRF